MCVVNKHFELIEFVFNSIYVDLKYNEISLTFIWYVCEVVSVPFVGNVGALSVMCELFHVCMLRYCEGSRVTPMLVWGSCRCGCRWYTLFN